MKSNTHLCRCCGHVYDLTPYGGFVDYSICPICLWEEDVCGEDEYSCPNGMTLREYRKDFLSKTEQHDHQSGT